MHGPAPAPRSCRSSNCWGPPRGIPLLPDPRPEGTAHPCRTSAARSAREVVPAPTRSIPVALSLPRLLIPVIVVGSRRSVWPGPADALAARPCRSSRRNGLSGIARGRLNRASLWAGVPL
ncbi:hypothetical protein B6E66_23770 [Streptomyces maremycinicus]|nr:hypothetical protein B6E66_23770 [Streptomyces sp. B9173]